MNGLGLGDASKAQGFFDVIPSGTQCVLVMKIRPGTIGIENLLKRTSKGDAEMLDAEFTVVGGDYDRRKLFANLVLDGTTAGHAKAGEFSRSMLRAIFEAVHGIDPNDNSPATRARRDGAALSQFNGATFIATVEIEKGGKRTDGDGFYKDKNVIGKVLRPGDPGYRKLDQPPPQPVERSGPPPQPQTPGAVATPPANGTPGVAMAVIKKPDWAE